MCVLWSARVSKLLKFMNRSIYVRGQTRANTHTGKQECRHTHTASRIHGQTDAHTNQCPTRIPYIHLHLLSQTRVRHTDTHRPTQPHTGTKKRNKIKDASLESQITLNQHINDIERARKKERKTGPPYIGSGAAITCVPSPVLHVLTSCPLAPLPLSPLLVSVPPHSPRFSPRLAPFSPSPS